ncbi:MAG: flagellar motor protein [Anaerolineae bacterium]|jgi:chemotaxis protein MotA
MDIGTVVGLVLGFGAMVVAFMMEGGSPSGLVQVTAAIIVFGGTIAATMVSFPLSTVLKLPKLVMLAIKAPRVDKQAAISLLVQLADKARREGLLSLEEEARRIEDPFLHRGVMLVVDGVDPEVVRDILEADLAGLESRHKAGHGVLEAMGGFSPTMGIIGTVMGLVSVLGSLEEPDGLGHKIAVAFIATLYGVAFANLVYLPLANKLKSLTAAEVQAREMMIEGVLAVQAGENPRVVREKLETFLAPSERGAEGQPRARAGAPASASARAQA